MTVLHRERVLRAATSSFLAHGYRSSVDEIARRAGVAKQTVYHHFPNKDELFKEVARALASRVLIELESPPADLREGLLRFALAYRQRTLSAQGISAFRTLVPEVPRFRAVARAMYGNSAGEMVRRLAEYLDETIPPSTQRWKAQNNGINGYRPGTKHIAPQPVATRLVPHSGTSLESYSWTMAIEMKISRLSFPRGACGATAVRFLVVRRSCFGIIVPACMCSRMRCAFGRSFASQLS